MTEQTRTVIIDLTDQTIVGFTPDEEDFFEKIDWQFGKVRGNKFQRAIETVSCIRGKMRISGSDNHYQEILRPNRAEARYEILETWQWTGRKWKQIS